MNFIHTEKNIVQKNVMLYVKFHLHETLGVNHLAGTLDLGTFQKSAMVTTQSNGVTFMPSLFAKLSFEDVLNFVSKCSSIHGYFTGLKVPRNLPSENKPLS